MQARAPKPSWEVKPLRSRVVALGVGGALAVGLVLTGRAHAGHGHPAKIHDGTCDRLGTVAFTLNGVGTN